jgi:hypothetical protein
VLLAPAEILLAVAIGRPAVVAVTFRGSTVYIPKNMRPGFGGTTLRLLGT